MRNPFAAQFAALAEQLAGGHDDAVTKSVAALVADETASQESLARLAQLRSVIDKLSRRAGAASSTVLQQLGAEVQVAQRALRYRARADAQDRAAATVRARVHELLAVQGPMRPLDLARELEVDPSQVSRALRELRSQDCVRQTPEAPLGDARGRWYELIGGENSVREAVLATLAEQPWQEIHFVGQGRTKVVRTRVGPATAAVTDQAPEAGLG